jgi:hypothetical protein
LNLDPNGIGGSIDFLRSTAIHEFGLAIGFNHEHQHPNDRIIWNRANVLKYFAGFGWNSQMIQDNIFNVLNDPNQFSFTKDRDPKSIMHYWYLKSDHLYDTDSGVPVPETPNRLPSTVDQQFCATTYGCSFTPTNTTDTTSTTDISKPIVGDRQKLEATKAKALTLGETKTGEFTSDSQMLLFKIDGTSDDYVFETVDGARAGVPFGGAMPVVLELFNGTDFSEDKSVQVSSFGAFDSTNPLLTSLGAQDAFLAAKLAQGTTYYVLARPQQRLNSRSKGAFTLLARKATSSRDTKGTWNQLRQEISDMQGRIRSVQSETATLQKGLRK